MLRKILLAALAATTVVALPARAQDAKPTIVLIHGAFAASESWDKVTKILLKDGFNVVSVANPLRGLKFDSDYATDVVEGIEGPVVLVGHSYGGAVISNVNAEHADIKGLVYVAAFTPDTGESLGSISQKFPGSTLEDALAKPVALANGDKDLYIDQNKFHAQFAADVPADMAALMAVAQRPLAVSALEGTTEKPLWKSAPSWHIFGTSDKNITAAAMQFMAERAKSKETVTVDGASHVVMISHPEKVAAVIENAAR